MFQSQNCSRNNGYLLLQTGVSFLLFFLAIIAIFIAAVYLHASTLHEREIKISVRGQESVVEMGLSDDFTGRHCTQMN